MNLSLALLRGLVFAVAGALRSRERDGSKSLLLGRADDSRRDLEPRERIEHLEGDPVDWSRHSVDSDRGRIGRASGCS